MHPAADLFPLMGEAQLFELAADIRENGLHYPVVETKDGRLLDGRARYIACDIAAVPVFWKTYTGDDPWEYALTRNYATRQPDVNERAFLLARVKHRHGGTPPLDDPHHLSTPVRRRVAELLHTSPAQIQRAREVHTRGVDGLEQCVLTHNVSMNTAARVAALPAEQQHEFIARVRGGMSPHRAAPRKATTPPAKRGRPRNQHTNGERYRYIQREGLAAIRDSLAVLRHVQDTSEGLAPDIDVAEAEQWLADLGHERRNLTRLMNLLKERTQ